MKGSTIGKKIISKVHFCRYFQRLVENFETQMLSYRQQIETLEGHLHSISQPSILSPEGEDKVTVGSFLYSFYYYSLSSKYILQFICCIK